MTKCLKFENYPVFKTVREKIVSGDSSTKLLYPQERK